MSRPKVKPFLLLSMDLFLLISIFSGQSVAAKPMPTLENTIERVRAMKQKGSTRKEIADFVTKTVANQITFVNHASPKKEGQAVSGDTLRAMKDRFNTWRDKGDMVDDVFSPAAWAWENRMGQCNESASSAFHILAMAFKSTSELAILQKGDHVFLVWGDIEKIPASFSADDLLNLNDSYLIDPWDNQSFSTTKLSWFDRQHGNGTKVSTLPYKLYMRQYRLWLAKCRANPDAYQKWLHGKVPASDSTGLGNTAGGTLQNIKLFGKIAITDSAKVNPFPGIKIKTSQWWPDAYKMCDSKSIGQQAKRPGMKLYLAGTQDGKKGWDIDNFLFIEISLGNRKVKRVVVGSVETVSYRGQEVDHLGAGKFNFGPKEIDLAQHIPDGARFALTITPLDYGGKKFLSDVWLIFEYTSPTKSR